MNKTKTTGIGFFRLCLILYPFVAAALAINLFMLGLVGQFMNLSSMSPLAALGLAAALGPLVTWFVARWVQRLIAEAER